MRLFPFVPLLALNAVAAPFFGSSANLSSSVFCRTYACSPAVLSRGESPAYIYAHPLSVPGVIAKLFRYPKQASPTPNQARTAPVLAASLDVWIGPKTDRRAAARVARDFVKTVGGPDELPELYEDCLLNGRRSDVPVGFETTIIRTSTLAVKCAFSKPGALVSFVVSPVLSD